MAKRKSSNGVNKSQAIREALGNDPDASPKEVSAKLNASGIKA
jgi:hypothetical protein